MLVQVLCTDVGRVDVGRDVVNGGPSLRHELSDEAFAVGTLEADLVVAGVDVEPCPPRVPRPRADPLPRPPRCVMPPRADQPREADLVIAGVGAEPRPPRDEPRPRTEPPCCAVPGGAEPAGDEPSGGAGQGDDPGESALLTGTGGLSPPGGAGYLPQAYHQKSQAHRWQE